MIPNLMNYVVGAEATRIHNYSVVALEHPALQVVSVVVGGL